MKRYKLTELAAGDIKGISDYTGANFGNPMRKTYNELIRLGVASIVSEPRRRGVTVVRHSGESLLTYHLRHVKQTQVKAPRHLIVYRLSANGFITILRVLHESMDISRHVDNDN
ncbi:hypothetical protein IP70_02140 [alpha proteobacterium AAP38]|uniref:type II toxin-antitoxin system RelE/ParE family toxin n=1 Tax=Niveispirillum sp. TaxID=1917217 RepID=UPI0006B8D8A5|nr:hypothetical protein IP70_02140 [alpha proteobacterium AAP38]